MLTRIYTPYGIPSAPVRPRSEQHGAEQEESIDRQKEAPNATPPPIGLRTGNTPDFNAGEGTSRGLASVHEQGQSQRIRIGSILQDFQSTMQALGADESTQGEVMAYLNGVALQARKERPEVPFIKQSLRTAANSLDSYITQALGSPSQVVREWVDALLMQPIEFHQPDATLPASPATTTVANEATPTAPRQIGFSKQEKAQIKRWMTEAQTAQQKGDSAQAQNLLKQALDLAETRRQPATEGRLLLQLGRSLEAGGKLADAQTLYRSAAEKFSETGQVRHQARCLAALGGVLERQGQLIEAEPVYTEALTLLGEQDSARSHLLNDLGGVQLLRHQPEQAIASFQAAYEALPEKSPQARADLFSNLGAAYRQNRDFEQALKSYRLSLAASREARSKPAYRHALQQMAGLYVELDQPRKAMQALDRLRQI